MTAIAEVATRRDVHLRVEVESHARVEGCRLCGVVAASHGRRMVRVIDIPYMGRPVELWWRKRTWRCTEPACEVGTFTGSSQLRV